MPLAFQQPYLHFTLVCTVYLLIALSFFFIRLKGLFSQLRRKWKPAPYEPGLLRYYKNAVLFWSIWVLLGAGLLAFSFYLTRYQYLGSRADVAGVAIFQKGAVEYTNYDGKEMRVPVEGPQAAACGIFFKFPRWMRYLGLETYHSLLTFRGSLENEYHYMQPDPEWLQSYVDTFVLFLYKNRKSLFIESVYIESPYFSATGKKRNVYVTHSGYII